MQFIYNNDEHYITNQVYNTFLYLYTQGRQDHHLNISTSYIIVKISSISTPAQVLQGMCNEDDNSSEILLTFAPLKANDQDMSLRSSDQNIMKIPTDGFQEFNIIFAYFTFPSYLFIAQKRQRHFCIHNTTQYGKIWK